MNLLSWTLAISFVTWVLIQSFQFQRATVCRQKRWLRSVEAQTGALLTRPSKLPSLPMACKGRLTLALKGAL
jgi:hypothetical protein